MASEGSFCPTAGAPSFSQCTRDGNGCFTVTGANQNCTTPQVCSVAGVVATGTACGCPANGTTLGTACADRNVADSIASPTDNAVLQCQMVGACRVWRILANCADQSMTAGTVGGLAVCVCKPAGSLPGDAHSLYVDPNPPIASGMNGPPTGASQPPACRFPSLTAALAATGATFNRVVAIHETSTSASFSNESLPIVVPAGVELTTADGPSFNTAHYTIVLNGGQTFEMIRVLPGASLSGFTIDGMSAASSTALIASGATAADEPGTGSIDLHHLNILSAGTSQVAIQIRNLITATGNQIRIAGPSVGIDVVRSHASATASARFTGTAIDSTSTTVGARVGAGAPDNGVRSSLVLSNSTLTVGSGVGVSVTGGDATLTGVTVKVNGTTGARRGVSLSGPTAAVTLTGGSVTLMGDGDVIGLDVGNGGAILNATPIVVANSGTGVRVAVAGASANLAGLAVTTGNSGKGVAITAGMAVLSNVTLTGGSDASGVTLSGGAATIAGSTIATGGKTSAGPGSVGLADTDGTVTVTGTSITVGAGSRGIVESGAARVTITGSLTTNSVVSTSVATGSIDGDGITITPGSIAATLAISGNTAINKFRNGVVINDGTVDIAGGNVIVSANTGDGLQLLNAAIGNNYHVAATSLTSQGNMGNGVRLNTNVLTTIDTSTISSNLGDGVLLEASNPTPASGNLFILKGSTIASNFGRGVAITGMRRVGTLIQNNKISLSGLSGVLVSGAGGVVVDVTIMDNEVFGNLTTSVNADNSILGGGVFFAKPSSAGPLPLITLRRFGGNKVYNNLRNQIAFDLAQSGGTAWNLSSDPMAVDMASACQDVAEPNSVYCYTGGGNNLGVAIPDGATLIPVVIHGMHFKNSSALAGSDYSTQISTNAPIDMKSGVSFSCSAVACPVP
jgi:hypothetical protein